MHDRHSTNDEDVILTPQPFLAGYSQGAAVSGPWPFSSNTSLAKTVGHVGHEADDAAHNEKADRYSRACIVAFAGCAAQLVGALIALVAGIALPDESAAQTVVATAALWIVAICVVVTAAAAIYLFVQFIWMLVRAGKGTHLPAAGNTRRQRQD